MRSRPSRPNGETYFFRDHGQMDLLHQQVLPELIRRRGAVKSLRLWSAGCASGEEPYSLAMLLDMLLPDKSGWDIFILGTDIDEQALAKAQGGVYGRWSFRLVPSPLRERYFRPRGDEWLLDPRIRDMVRFRTSNMVGEPCPDGDLRDMDLILCRNVFIYYDAETIAATARKLAGALRGGGRLVVGHTELLGQDIRSLRAKMYPEGVVYVRSEEAPAGACRIEARPDAGACVRAPGPARPRRLKAPPARPPGPESAGPPPQHAEDSLALARGSADRGDYAQAEQHCRQALSAAPLSAAPYFLLAHLAQINGEYGQARELLEKTLYLDPRHVAAHLELAELCQRGDDPLRAKTLRRAVLEILRALPEATLLEPYEATAGDMVRWMTGQEPSAREGT